MVDEPIAELLGDPPRERLELFVDKFDDLAGLDVDQMVVMRVRRGFITRSAIAKLVTLENSRLLEQADSAIDRRDRDFGVDRGGALVKRLDVGVILGLAQHARDRAALLGDPEALVGAQLFDVDSTVHGPRLKWRRDKSQPSSRSFAPESTCA